MALEGITHPSVARQCPLLGEQRASTDGNPMSAFDPKRTFAWWQMAPRTCSRTALQQKPQEYIVQRMVGRQCGRLAGLSANSELEAAEQKSVGKLVLGSRAMSA
jgi:hypothetical protein